jgi:hypothetical protein
MSSKRNVYVRDKVVNELYNSVNSITKKINWRGYEIVKGFEILLMTCLLWSHDNE